MAAKTLLQLCQKIEAGYAAGLTMYDAGMVGAAEELTSRTAEIAELIAGRDAQKAIAQAPNPIEIEMGFRSRMLECLMEVAKSHGEDSEPDHEVGDLQDLLRPMWESMTPAQQRSYLASDAVATMLEGAAASAANGDEDLVLMAAATVGELEGDEWARACARFGLDTSFVYPDDSVVEIVNAFRCEHLLDEPAAKPPTPGARQS